MAITVIQGLKRIKHLSRKIETTQERIKKWCSYMSDEEPLYKDIPAMIQSVNDMQTEIGRIRHAIHVLNATTTVVFQNKSTTIDELLIEATVNIPVRIDTLQSMRRKEKNQGWSGQREPQNVSVVMQYDPHKRDKDLDALVNLQADINDFLDMQNIQLELPL